MRIYTLIITLLLTNCTKSKNAMNTEFDIDAYFEKASNHLAALNEVHQGTWNLGSAERWDADQETGIITWTFQDGVVVRAPFQIIGTYNTLDSTFLWAWDHPSIAEPVRKDAIAVQEFAKKHDIDFLLDRKIECDEGAAWDLAALATLVCDRQGAYRGPAGTTYVFMTFGNVEISKPK
jgi:hypothetical protein